MFDGNIGREGPDPRRARAGAWLEGHDSTERDHRFVLARGPRIEHVGHGLPFAGLAGDYDVGARQQVGQVGVLEAPGETDASGGIGRRPEPAVAPLATQAVEEVGEVAQLAGGPARRPA